MREIDWIRRYIAPLVDDEEADRLKDDAAMLTLNGTFALSTDMLVEGRHFLAGDPLDTVGRKLVRVTVSDLIAKGALPFRAMVSIAWPKGRGEADFAALISGLGADLAYFGMALVGGDTVSTDGPLCLNLAGLGRVAGTRLVRRRGARPGDQLLVSGVIGAAGLGLAALKRGMETVHAAHYRVPNLVPVSMAHWISDHASASLDVSDGLLLDAARLAEVSDVALEIDLNAVPLAEPSSRLEEVLAQCTAGDDYQMLMTVPEGCEAPGLTPIGRVSSGSGLSLCFNGRNIPLPSRLGFEHGE